MIKKYNCPGCGADMAYDPALNKLSCSHCGFSEPVMPDDDGNKEGGPGDFGEAYEYHCPNCGSILVTDEKTSSVTCEYCQAPLVLCDRLAGNYRPQKIIPFKIDKKAAKAAFKKWCHNGWFAPAAFMKSGNISKLHGTYVPYWLFHVKAHATVSGTATKVHVSRRGDTEYIKTSYFRVFREGEMEFANVPHDASERMPDEEMAKLEPYRFSEIKTFAMPYLAGFDSSQYDYEDGQLYPEVKERLAPGAVGRLRQTFPAYTTVELSVQNVDFMNLGNEYALLPVWSLSTVYKGKEYRFMMNGQTGRVVGRSPVSAGKIAIFGAAVSILCFAILMIVG